MHGRHVCKGIADSVLRTFVLVAFFTTRVYRRLRARVFAVLYAQVLFILPGSILNAHKIAFNLCAQVLFALSEAFLNAHRIAINLCAHILFALPGAFLRV